MPEYPKLSTEEWLPDPDIEDGETQAQASFLIEAAEGESDLISLLLGHPDPAVRMYIVRAIFEAEAGTAALRRLIGIVESESHEAVYRLLAKWICHMAKQRSNGWAAKDLGDIAAADASEKRRVVLLETLLRTILLEDNPPKHLAWIALYVRERILSDDSNFVRAETASNILEISEGNEYCQDFGLREFAVQWFLHTGIARKGEVPSLGAHTKLAGYFDLEPRSLLAAPRSLLAAPGPPSNLAGESSSSLYLPLERGTEGARKPWRAYLLTLAVLLLMFAAAGLGQGQEELRFAWKIAAAGLVFWLMYRVARWRPED